MTVTLRLPAVLKDALGTDRLEVSGGTLVEALDSAYAAQPRLRHLITLDSGELRPHILCIVNGESVMRDEIDGVELSDGDEIWIHQAISGG